MKTGRFIATYTYILLVTASFLGAQAHTIQGVHVDVMSTSKQKGIIQWKITNGSPQVVFVYSTFLYGPWMAYKKMPDRVVFFTTPTNEDNACINAFPEVHLVSLARGSSIEGTWKDPELIKFKTKFISFVIGVGPDAKSLNDEIRRLQHSKNCEDPYNAIIRWETTVESAPFMLH